MHNLPVAHLVPAAARRTARVADRLAERRDRGGSFPTIEVAALHRHGLLHAPLPVHHGGMGLGLYAATAPILRDVLRIIGGASLPLGRLYEGHVNAVRLVARFGTDRHLAMLGAEAEAGRLSAVWNAETPPGLTLEGGILAGTKRYTSGTGHVRRPVLTATTHGGVMMAIPDVAAAIGDLSEWLPTGMAATATGSIDFTGIAVRPGDIVGAAGDYYRSPYFAGGAWRVLAVQLGGLERLVTLYREAMATRGRSADPVQRARFGGVLMQLETARLWTARAAAIAEDSAQDAGTIDAFVNLARHAFDRAALDIIERVQRGIGLSAMLRPAAVERIARDLVTYLRQPFPDAALDAAAGWGLATHRDMHSDLGD